MNNERNEMPGYNGHHTSDLFPYAQSPTEPKGDLRSAPRLDMSAPPRRRCTGELREDNNAQSSKHGWGLQSYPLAMVYSPYQSWQSLYTPDVALEKGTLFSELDLPIESANYRRGC